MVHTGGFCSLSFSICKQGSILDGGHLVAFLSTEKWHPRSRLTSPTRPPEARAHVCWHPGYSHSREDSPQLSELSPLASSMAQTPGRAAHCPTRPAPPQHPGWPRWKRTARGQRRAMRQHTGQAEGRPGLCRTWPPWGEDALVTLSSGQTQARNSHRHLWVSFPSKDYTRIFPQSAQHR